MFIVSLGIQTAVAAQNISGDTNEKQEPKDTITPSPEDGQNPHTVASDMKYLQTTTQTASNDTAEDVTKTAVIIENSDGLLDSTTILILIIVAVVVFVALLIIAMIFAVRKMSGRYSP